MGGDTGYCQVFQEIGDRFPDITFAIIPIGAYLPRWFMNPQHVSPEEAIEVFKELKAKSGLGCHWLTFDLASDTGSDALLEFEYYKKVRAQELGMENIEHFLATPVGQTITYPNPQPRIPTKK